MNGLGGVVEIEDDTQPVCAMCGSIPLVFLGVLGRLVWLRCRWCGMTQIIPPD